MNASTLRAVFSLVSSRHLIGGLRAYARYAADWRHYSRLPGAELLRLRDCYPCVWDRSPSTPYDPHYFYQAVWAMERIAAARPSEHVDVGSEVGFVGMLTTHVPVVFVDLRPLEARLPRAHFIEGNILALPFENRSLESISCLHVAEHVGLGRYGDNLSPHGTREACAELARTLAPEGNLYFSVPVGRPRVCFNAHRIHRVETILEYFHGLHLAEFSAINDHGELGLNASVAETSDQTYACGLFHFRRA